MLRVKALGKVYTLTPNATLIVRAQQVPADAIVKAIESEPIEHYAKEGVYIHEVWVRRPQGIMVLKVSINHTESLVLGMRLELTD
jgi:hypothetical protein